MNARYDARRTMDAIRENGEQLTTADLIKAILKAQDNPFVSLRVEVYKAIVRARQAKEQEPT